MKKSIQILLAAALLLVPRLPVHAESEPLPGESVHVPYVTLLSEFTLYPSKETKPAEAIGALTPLQSVLLADVEEQSLLGVASQRKIAVETWLGTAWLNMDEGSYKFGKLEQREQQLTLLQEQTELYANIQSQPSPYTLAPQRVQAIASIPVCDPYTPCYSNDRWFLIRTSWLGDQWIRPGHYAEKYVGSAVEGMIAVAEPSEVFLHPFDKPIADEPRFQPQVVKPVSKYIQQARMVPPSVWYQVETPRGLRWIHLGSEYGLGYERAQAVEQSINIPVPFQFYKSPFSSDSATEEQVPRQLQAVGSREGGWLFVLTGEKGSWVNPSMEAASRITGEWDNDVKLGVKQSQAELHLTETSVILSKPFFEGSTELLLSPQTVTASREWTSPHGETWYYIHTWQGAKWVRP
ncbi:hypothetical protein RAC89_06655 [Paenibacillus sp. GD4]|uniref:hypothetical protein n=1 Tax=Paenibacillus sp. GD4 TaxID=3068890 RepID=UPI002796D19A|nr:hypothetical protein [Paenibacillus sp. GD4]MDQ1910178.1 hypothetical protein [Paenibacillus sp. GD4]